jgi:hypothetical protein
MARAEMRDPSIGKPLQIPRHFAAHASFSQRSFKHEKVFMQAREYSPRFAHARMLG